MSSMKMPSAPNAGLFKQGYSAQSSEDGVVSRNIAAVREIAAMVRTSVGPSGRNKIVVNHLGKIFLTSDASTILRELDIVHPAVKVVVMAAQQQEAEYGDASNLVIVLAGELLNKADDLIRIGMAPAEIAKGYELAVEKAVATLDNLRKPLLTEFNEIDKLAGALKAVIAPKHYGSEDILCKLVAEAASYVMPPNSPERFNVDNVRVVKVLGSSLPQSYVVRGMVFNSAVEGAVKKVENAKVAIYTCAVDISQTETKGTVLLNSAQEMLDFSKGEEEQVEKLIKGLADAGIRVVIAGSTVGALALHFMNRHGILVFRVASKFELQRLCRVTGAAAQPKLVAPTREDVGHVDIVETTEIGGDRVTVFRQESSNTRTATIVLRGATTNLLDDLERAVDDGVAAIKSLSKNGDGVPGAGATELSIAQAVFEEGERTSSILQHALKRYGQAFEVVPQSLAENAGQDATAVLAELYAGHARAQMLGVDVDGDSESATLDAIKAEIFDLALAKRSAIRLATEAACTVLLVDAIIMAKRAGGPAVPQQGGDWDQD